MAMLKEGVNNKSIQRVQILFGISELKLTSRISRNNENLKSK